MIKTEQLLDSDEAYEDPAHIKDRDIILIIVVILIVVGFLGYLFLVKPTHQVKLLPSDHYKNITALPLSTPSRNSINGYSSTNSISNQPNSASSNLGSGNINLQNNLPASTGSGNPSNSLQSVNGSQSTGQSINPNQPY